MPDDDSKDLNSTFRIMLTHGEYSTVCHLIATPPNDPDDWEVITAITYGGLSV